MPRVGIAKDLAVSADPEPEAGEPVKEPVVRLQVQRSTLRCPFCHETCKPRDSVACLYCLGRHHAACWLESRLCASCGADEWLVPESRAGGFRSEPELYALLEEGRSDEVAEYLEHCRAYAKEARQRTSDLATRIAFERLGETLERIQAFRVVGARRASEISVESVASRFLAWLSKRA